MSKVWLAVPSLPSSTEASLCDSLVTCVAVHIKTAYRNHTALTKTPSSCQANCQSVYETYSEVNLFFSQKVLYKNPEILVLSEKRRCCQRGTLSNSCFVEVRVEVSALGT